MSFFANAIYIDGAAAPIEATDTIQKHSVGTRMILDDGRVFVYAKSSVAITRTDLGAKNVVQQGVAQRAVGAAAVVGDRSVTFTTVSPDGITGNGSIIEDEFVGGYVLLFTTGATAPFDKQVRRITGNTATPTVAAGEITITFDRGLEIALAVATSKIEVMHSPYAGVAIDNNISYPVVGIPSCLADSGVYLWLQTWGICWASPQAGVGVGGSTGLVFRHDGSLQPIACGVSGDLTIPEVLAADLDSTQYAGYVIAGLAAQTQAAPFFMLQLAP